MAETGGRTSPRPVLASVSLPRNPSDLALVPSPGSGPPRMGSREAGAAQFDGMPLVTIERRAIESPRLRCRRRTSPEDAMRFVKESRIAAPPSVVFAFHESAGALERLMPPWEKFERLEGGGSIRPGSRVVLRTRVGP